MWFVFRRKEEEWRNNVRPAQPVPRAKDKTFKRMSDCRGPDLTFRCLLFDWLSVPQLHYRKPKGNGEDISKPKRDNRSDNCRCGHSNHLVSGRKCDMEMKMKIMSVHTEDRAVGTDMTNPEECKTSA